MSSLESSESDKGDTTVPPLVFSTQVRRIKHAAPGICMLTLDLDDSQTFSYKAGQYVWIKFGTFSPRPYSVAGYAAPGTIDIHIKDSGAGGASTYVLKKLKPGQSVKLSSPVGNSVFPPPDNTGPHPLLLVAGGLGIAPLKVIAETAIDKEWPVDLFWGVNHEDELYLDDLFTQLDRSHDNFSYTAITGEPVTQILAQNTTDLARTYIYLGGPPPMIAATEDLLLAQNARPERIFYDRL